ncbi:MAG: antitoxin [Beutenbergiaceae bacterium]
MPKISVSLSARDIQTLDAYVESARLGSRSAGLAHAIRLLDLDALDDAYTAAWSEWEESGQAQAWDAVADDGIR